MSVGAIGAAMQGFMQGAMDFVKMYQAMEAFNQQKQYQDRMLKLKQQQLEQQNEYNQNLLDLRDKWHQQQLENENKWKSKEFELNQRKLDILNREDIERRIQWDREFQLKKQQVLQALNTNQTAVQQSEFMKWLDETGKRMKSLLDLDKQRISTILSMVKSKNGALVLDTTMLDDPNKLQSAYTNAISILEQQVKAGDKHAEKLFNDLQDAYTKYNTDFENFRKFNENPYQFLGVNIQTQNQNPQLQVQPQPQESPQLNQWHGVGTGTDLGNQQNNSSDNYYMNLLK